MSKLTELRDMLAKATGPSREIDAAIMAMIYTRDDRKIGTQENDGTGWKNCTDNVWVDPVTDQWVSTAAYHYTSSIDAALARAARLLPGRNWRIERIGPQHHHGLLCSTSTAASSPPEITPMPPPSQRQGIVSRRAPVLRRNRIWHSMRPAK